MRYHSATLGRWLNRDPIGDFAAANLAFGELGGANVYAYVGNNPTNLGDYRGLASASCAGSSCSGAGV